MFFPPTVTDKENKEVAERTFRALNAYAFSVDLDAVSAPDMLDMYSSLQPYANGEHNIAISVQLGSGDLVTVFEGTFTK